MHHFKAKIPNIFPTSARGLWPLVCPPPYIYIPTNEIPVGILLAIQCYTSITAVIAPWSQYIVLTSVADAGQIEEGHEWA